jgi:hypothetical protein
MGSAGASAATIEVSNTNDAGVGSLRDAVAAAIAGDSIVFSSSTDGTAILLTTGEIPIGVSLTIVGNGASNTVLSGSMLGRVFSITNAGAVELNGLTITMGQADNGGALYIMDTDVMLVDCAVTSSTASINGGGIHAMGGSLSIMGSTISGNTASGAAATEGGGGIYNAMNTLSVDATSSITNNLANGAAGSGGGLFTASGTVQITGTLIEGNSANRAGGGIEITVGDLTLTGVMLNGNDASGGAGTPNPGNGGGLHATGASTILITGGTVNMNSAGREGGGLWNASGTMTVDAVMIDGNIASGPAANDGGGGLFNNGGTLIVHNGTMITNNVADGAAGSGGGVFNEVNGVLTIMESTITGNTAVRAGGGIEDNAGAAGSVTLVEVILNNNSTGSSPGNGGGFHITGPGVATITGGTVNGNTAALEGGGLWNGTGTMLVDGVTIDGNVANGALADQGGGGIFAIGGTVTVQNGTVISSNMANGAAGSGGGIMIDTTATLIIMNSTLHNNHAMRAGGGIEVFGKAGFLHTVTDVIFTDNTTGPAPGNGGAVHITGPGDMNIAGGSVTGNTATREGGGLWNGSGTMIVDGVMIDGNIASGPAANDGGGGLFNNGGTLIVQNGTMITNNVADGAAGSGGGVFNEVNGVLTIMESTITGNTAVRAGGGIEDNAGAAGSVTLVDVVLNNNSTGSSPGNGGGFHITGPGVATITGGTVNGNVAALEGGGLWNGTGTMLVDGVTIDGNVANGALADQGGGGIFAIGGTVTVQNGTVISNNMASGAAGSGGGIMIDTTATLIIMNSTLHNNHANRAGGGIEVFGQMGLLHVLTDVIFTDNTTGPAPGNGGAVHITGPGDMNITGGSVTGNTATREGGGLWNGSGTMVVDGVMIDGNIASGPAADDGGGGLFNNGGTLIVQNGTSVTNNLADGAAGSGGGLFNFNGIVTIDSVYFGQNEAVRAGGGIEALNGTTTVSNSMFVGNDCSEEGVLPAFAPGNGGAVHVTGAGTFTFMTSTAEGNHAGNEGGGLWGANAGVLNIVRSTVNDNLAPKGGGLFLQGGGPDTGVLLVDRSTIVANKGTTGGGVQVNGGMASLMASTIAGNSATDAGGGAFLMAGYISTNSSILADNSAPMAADFSGAFTTATFTLVEDGMGASGISDGVDGNRIGVDPGLMPLMDNGGPTKTKALMCGSVAIDSGDLALAASDQRDLPVFGVQRDMGAYELQIDCDELCAEFSVDVDWGCVAVENGWATITAINGALEPLYIEWSTGEMGMSIAELLDGEYWVIVKDANGCSVKIDFMIDCSTVGIDALDGALGASLRVFPVPANNVLNVEVSAAQDGAIDFHVADALGRRVMERGNEVFAASTPRTVTLDVNALGNGSYLLTLVDRSGNSTTIRFMVAR